MNRGPVLVAAGIAVGVGLAALVSTCTRADEGRTVASDASLTEQCPDVPASASRLTVEAGDGFDLGAAVVQRGELGAGDPLLVLRHGASHTLCDWLAWSDVAAEAAGAGVLLLDRRGQGSSPGRDDLSRDPADVRAAVDASGLLTPGRPLVVMGSSMGNASAFSLLDEMPTRACAAIGVSPVPGAGPLDGISALRTTAPEQRPESVHLVWAEEDGTVPTHGEDLLDAARAAEIPAVAWTVEGQAHARAVLDDHPQAQQFVLDVISGCRQR